MERVIKFNPNDLTYPFDGRPYFETIKGDAGYTSNIHVDTFPCYSMDKNTVLKEVERVESLFPIKFKPKYYIIPFDSDSHTNGCAYENSMWNDAEKIGEHYSFRPYIIFWGKRIPIHPAMIRYLVAHEYSHIIQHWIEYKRGLKNDTTTIFDIEYAKLRNIPLDNSYGGGRWHTNIGEIIANDCRICIFNSELEFWPHDCVHPLEDKNVVNFWKEMYITHHYKD